MTGPSDRAVEAAAEALAPYAEHGLQADDMARAALSAAIPILRAELADELVKNGPVLNYELNYDGTEDPIRAAYVEAFRDAVRMIEGEA